MTINDQDNLSNEDPKILSLLADLNSTLDLYYENKIDNGSVYSEK